MRNMNIASLTRLSLAGILIVFLLSGAAFAGTTFKPDCGAPGDRLVIMGEGFGEDPAVQIDGVDAEVWKSNDRYIVCEVPADTATGAVDVTVDSTLLDDEFIVLAAGAPVVCRVSAEKATPGMSILVVGRRLGGGEVRFVDSSGETAATVTPKGKRMALMITIPEDLDPGVYTLEIENADGISSGDCSPEITIVASGNASITAIADEGALPGGPITIEGTDLSPPGICRVIWTDSAGDDIVTKGITNGYDRIFTSVPFQAEAGESYDVSVALRDGQDWNETSSIAYEVGTPDAPAIEGIDPESGPAGSLVKLTGTGFVTFGGMPTVTFDDGTDQVQALVFGMKPGFGQDKAGAILVLVPEELADGEYDVTVAVGDQSSEAVTFTVKQNELTVTSMKPDGGKGKRFAPLILLTGTGFGTRHTTEIEVTFDDGENDPLYGQVLLQMDSKLLVAPPGTWKDPLPAGTYAVTVTRDPDGDAKTADAGDYVVE
jgi:hypothetical protein